MNKLTEKLLSVLPENLSTIASEAGLMKHIDYNRGYNDGIKDCKAALMRLEFDEEAMCDAIRDNLIFKDLSVENGRMLLVDAIIESDIIEVKE